MPVLKEKVLIKGDVAVSKPLAWVMRPKKEVPKVEQTIPIRIISAPKKKVPIRPMAKKTAKIEAVAERIIQERKFRSTTLRYTSMRTHDVRHNTSKTLRQGKIQVFPKKKLAYEREHIQTNGTKRSSTRAVQTKSRNMKRETIQKTFLFQK
jgi:apolipoprotein N-acyltransferase